MRFSFFLISLASVLLVGCTPSPEDAAEEVCAAMQSGDQALGQRLIARYAEKYDAEDKVVFMQATVRCTVGGALDTMLGQ
ncbi:MAG: hypothetical protein AAF089_16620 [Bacteroidota bacterium]